MSTSLIVPIDVRALAIGTATDLIGAANDFSNFPYTRDDGAISGESDYIAAAIGHYGQASVNQGVRLHWALPDALRRAEHEGGALYFPDVPNRWLVTRIVADGSSGDMEAPQLKSWVIESDRISTVAEGAAVSIPFADPARGGQYFRYLGRRSDALGWVEQGGKEPTADYFEGATGQRFTAVGHGDPGFAAFAPSCLNIFAMDDDFSVSLDEHQRAGPLVLSYVVTGWYAGQRGDPAAAQTLAAANALQWCWRQDAIPPYRTLFSGSVLGINWSPDEDAARIPVTQSPDISIGATSAQALAAMVGRDLKDRFVDAELALDAVMAGLLAKPHDGAGWVADLEAELHRKSYVPHDGGWTWAAIDPRVAAASLTQAATGQDEVILSADAALALSQLNTAQQRYDAAAFADTVQARQLFFDWYRRQLLASSRLAEQLPWSTAFPAGATDALEDLLRAGLDRLSSLRKQRGLLKIGRDDAGNDVAGLDQASGDTSLAAAVTRAWQRLAALIPTLHLKRLPAPRFWSPADPVILLRGEAARPAARGPQPSDLDTDGNLRCRLLDEVVRYPAFAAPTGLTLPEKDLAPAVAALIDEALLFDGRFDPWIVGKPSAAESLRDEVAVLVGGTSSLFTGVAPPQFARTAGSKPDWFPLLMRWSMDFRSGVDSGDVDAPRDLDASVLTDGHAIDPDLIDLRLKEGTPLHAAEPYSGWAILSSRPLGDLIGALSAGDTADDELAALVEDLRRAPVMAQTAGGLHEAMLMREAALQLKIFDPTEPLLGKNGGRHSVFPLSQRLSDAVGRITGHAPDPTRPYLAIRSGAARLASIRIVDVFGRGFDADVGQTSWARAYLPAPSDDAANADSVMLPARIAQPSRLQFRWLAADTDDVEATDHPAASPICGWVIPNVFSASLDLFAPDGAPLGSLRRLGSDGGTAWQSAPVIGATPVPTGDATAQAAALATELRDHPQLLAFAQAILKTPSYREAMLRAIDKALSTILPPDAGASLAMLLGRPLALVRATLGIELRGGAALDQSWSALLADATAAAGDGWDGARADRKLGQVTVPTRLGDTARFNDGMIGYFIGDGYDRLFSPTAAEEADGIAPERPLSLAAEDRSTIIAMLVDPRAPIHATTGVLPVKSIGLNPGLYQAAFDRLAVAFYAGPMLFPAGATPLPLPRGPGIAWHWWRPDNGAWCQRDVGPSPGDRARDDGGVPRLEEGWVALAPLQPPPAS